MVLHDPFPNISFRVKKLKFQIKNMSNNYVAIKNYTVQYKLQYNEHNREQKQQIQDFSSCHKLTNIPKLPK